MKKTPVKAPTLSLACRQAGASVPLVTEPTVLLSGLSLKKLPGTLLFLLVACSLLFGLCSSLEAKEYDGIWFLGFNLNQPPFDQLLVRQAVSHTLDRNALTNLGTSGEAVPGGLIPPGLPGYNPSLQPPKRNLRYAKQLMIKAGYPVKSQKLKQLSLLHTDGVKTVAIAEKIKQDLEQLGMKISLLQVSYREPDRWENELKSGKHQLFLMGYKAESVELFTSEAAPAATESFLLLDPLFKTSGAVNFTGFSDPTVDTLLSQVSVIGLSFRAERDFKLKQVNRLLYKEIPAIVLFYIEKL